MQENRALKEPKELAEKRVAELEHQLQKYEKDQMSIKSTNERLAQAERQVKNLEWENEVLQQRFLEVQREVRAGAHGRRVVSLHAGAATPSPRILPPLPISRPIYTLKIVLK